MNNASIFLLRRRAKKFLVCLLLSVASLYSHAQSCNCPPISSCRPCEGGLISLTLLYGGSPLGLVVVGTDGGGLIYRGTLSAGDIFTLTSSQGPGELFGANRINLVETAIGNTMIYTSCDTPIFVGDQFGNFTVIAATSLGGQAMCCTAAEMAAIPDPVFSDCPASQTVSVTSGCTASVSWTEPSATTWCGESATINRSHIPGTSFGLGITTVTYTASDSYGNSSTCSFNVTVIDNTEPIISGCPLSDIIVSANGSSCTATAIWGDITASDNCDTTPTVVGSHASGATFPIGQTVVTYTATDDAGETSTCAFKVIVVDDTPPVISGCPADLTVAADEACSAIASWTPPAAADNCSVTFTSTHDPGDTFLRGSTPVTYTAIDQSGNTSTCAFNVIVSDGSFEFSSCPSKIVVSSDGNCQTVVRWPVPTVTVDCVTLTSSHQPGDAFSIGTTPVTYMATDANGTSATCTFNVTVKDKIAPVIDCPTEVTALTGESCNAKVSWQAPVVTDCSAVTLTSTHQSESVFPRGTTAVTYTATDAHDNSSTCTFNVTVYDKTPPAFSNYAAEVLALAGVSCQARVTWTVPTITDNCEVATVTSTHHPGDSFQIGTTEVTYKASDNQGNSSSMTFKVIVKNDASAIFSDCPDEIFAKANESGLQKVEWTAPTASVPCGTLLSLISSHQPGDIFPVGITEVKYVATDDAGNISTCSFTVVVAHEELAFDVAKVLTPDGDGINDAWLLRNIEKFKDNKVIVVDRWGGVIYSASGYNNESVVWKGENSSGVVVPTGTYFYTVSVRSNSSTIEKRGFVELIR